MDHLIAYQVRLADFPVIGPRDERAFDDIRRQCCAIDARFTRIPKIVSRARDPGAEHPVANDVDTVVDALDDMTPITNTAVR